MKQVQALFERTQPFDSLAAAIHRERMQEPARWARFIEAHRNAAPYHAYSTGECLLLALALCKPEWLPEGYERQSADSKRWWRLDDEQVLGIMLWSMTTRD